MSDTTQAPPAEDDIRRLRERLSYDAETGELRWKAPVYGGAVDGAIAGCQDHRGYWFIRVYRKLLLGHRIAWAMHYGAWPEGDLDHRNADKSDNRISNLRPVTDTFNIANSFASNRNGWPKGCYRLKGRRRWYSQIRHRGVLRRLGTFGTLEEAAAAFRQAHEQINGEYSRCEARHG